MSVCFNINPRRITYLDTLALWQADPWLFLSNNEHITFTSSKLVFNYILDVDDVEASIVTFTVGDDTNTAHVTTTSNHGDGTGVEFDRFTDLSSGYVDLDSVVDRDIWIGVSNPTYQSVNSCPNLIQRLIDGNSRSRIMRNQVGNASFAQCNTLNLSKLILSFCGSDTMNSEASLGVVN
jgi:hypothetical protein